jgi:hypothetical protein
MYHLMVRRNLRQAFRDINAGAYEPIVAKFSAEHRHVMFGRHALAGERRTLPSTAQWYGRLKRLLPDLQFQIHGIAVTGWPWLTLALVTWSDRFSLPDGSLGMNQGVHEFILKWGRVHSLRVHCDTGKLERYCQQIAAGGNPEALAAPISDL